jgi:hypothetical protein
VPLLLQVLVFMSDLAGSEDWDPFGAGARRCTGAHLARPLLEALRTELAGRACFEPERGHRYSGRNNDGRTTLSETLYFARTVVSRLAGAGGVERLS